MRHAANSVGVSEIWFLGPRKSKEHENEATTTIIILAFYFIDPFPMFLVRDHFSCKSLE